MAKTSWDERIKGYKIIDIYICFDILPYQQLQAGTSLSFTNINDIHLQFCYTNYLHYMETLNMMR